MSEYGCVLGCTEPRTRHLQEKIIEMMNVDPDKLIWFPFPGLVGFYDPKQWVRYMDARRLIEDGLEKHLKKHQPSWIMTVGHHDCAGYPASDRAQRVAARSAAHAIQNHAARHPFPCRVIPVFFGLKRGAWGVEFIA